MTVAAVTLNVPVVAPAAAVTDAGVVRYELLSDSVTLAPPAGAAPDSVTVQLDVPPDVTLVGEQDRPDTVGAAATTEMLPPVPLIETDEPSEEAPIKLLSVIGTVTPLLAATWTVTMAITPLLNWLSFRPLARQVSDPALALQVTVLLAAVETAPAETAIELI